MIIRAATVLLCLLTQPVLSEEITTLTIDPTSFNHEYINNLDQVGTLYIDISTNHDWGGAFWIKYPMQIT